MARDPRRSTRPLAPAIEPRLSCRNVSSRSFARHPLGLPVKKDSLRASAGARSRVPRRPGQFSRFSSRSRRPPPIRLAGDARADSLREAEKGEKWCGSSCAWSSDWSAWSPSAWRLRWPGRWWIPTAASTVKHRPPPTASPPQLEILYWRELLWRGGLRKEGLLPTPEWRTLATLKLVSPGVCVAFAPGTGEPTQLCGQVEGVGAPAPAWFESVYLGMLGPQANLIRALAARQPEAGSIFATAEPQAAVRQAWLRVSTIANFAAAMALAIFVFAAVAIAHTLAPTAAIVGRPAPDGARRLSSAFAAVSSARVCADRARRQRSRATGSRRRRQSESR